MGYQNLHRPITNKHWQQVASIIKNVCAPENKELWVNQAPMLFACEDAEPTIVATNPTHVGYKRYSHIRSSISVTPARHILTPSDKIILLSMISMG